MYGGGAKAALKSRAEELGLDLPETAPRAEIIEYLRGSADVPPGGVVAAEAQETVGVADLEKYKKDLNTWRKDVAKAKARGDKPPPKPKRPTPRKPRVGPRRIVGPRGRAAVGRREGGILEAIEDASE